MGTLALVDATTWVGGFDFTTRLNELSVDISDEALDDTRFGTNANPRSAMSRIAGLTDVETELNGYWESASGGSVDEAAFTGLGNQTPVTHSVDGAETSVAYAYRARRFNYQLGGEVGAILPFTLGVMGSSGSPVVRGQVAAAVQDVSSTGAFGSPVNLGAGASGEFLYLAFHVFTAGTSIEVKVESDDAQAFSSPADVTGATIGPITATGGTWMTRVDASGITDTWFRMNITAITGTFNVAGMLAIQ